MAQRAPTTWRDAVEHRRKLADAVNGSLDGKTNNGGTVTLATSVATTVVTDYRVGTDSVLTFMPTTANASAELGNGTMYVSARGKNTFTITHANNAQADRTFAYAVLATGYSTATA